MKKIPKSREGRMIRWRLLACIGQLQIGQCACGHLIRSPYVPNDLKTTAKHLHIKLTNYETEVRKLLNAPRTNR